MSPRCRISGKTKLSWAKQGAETAINDLNNHATPRLSFQFIVFLIAALSLMAVDYRNATVSKSIRTAFSIFAYPLQVVVDMPFNYYNKVTHFFSNQHQLSNENNELKEQLLLYSVKYRDMQIIEQQNARLRELLGANQRTSYRFTMAEVLTIAGEGGRQVVTLNKGSRDGVYEKQVVLAEGGNIFGQVIDVTPFSAHVLQLTDRRHVIPVRNARTGIRALASGTGRSNMLELKSIIDSGDVKDGDIFVSSGLDRLFPTDFPVAQVIPNGIQYVPGDPFASVSARPFINFDNTREVLLLWHDDVGSIAEQESVGSTATVSEAR